jgi:hypothetical protein
LGEHFAVIAAFAYAGATRPCSGDSNHCRDGSAQKSSAAAMSRSSFGLQKRKTPPKRGHSMNEVGL